MKMLVPRCGLTEKFVNIEIRQGVTALLFC